MLNMRQRRTLTPERRATDEERLMPDWGQFPGCSTESEQPERGQQSSLSEKMRWVTSGKQGPCKFARQIPREVKAAYKDNPRDQQRPHRYSVEH